MQSLIYLLLSIFIISPCQADTLGESVIQEKIEKLISAINVDAEEQAMGELLTSARQSGINYGYRVFSISKNKRIEPEEIDNVLEDKLQVTIFVGDEPPYEEYIWHPKYNGHITRLIMP
jgi:hypothetical protein